MEIIIKVDNIDYNPTANSAMKDIIDSMGAVVMQHYRSSKANVKNGQAKIDEVKKEIDELQKRILEKLDYVQALKEGLEKDEQRLKTAVEVAKQICPEKLEEESRANFRVRV